MPITPLPLATNAFCRVDDVKLALGSLDWGDTQDDVMIAYINHFSKMAEGGAFCARLFALEEREHFADGIRIGYCGNNSYVNRIFLPAYPINLEEDFLVYDDSARLWPNETLRVMYDDYNVDPESGKVEFYGSMWSSDLRCVKIIYTGGLVSDVNGGSPVVPDDLRMACAIQVAHWLRIAKDPGAVQVSSMGGGQVTFFQPTQLLPNVKMVLESYKRFVV